MKAEDFTRVVRRRTVEMVAHSGSSHVGSALSIADIVGVLYSEVLSVDPADPAWAQRDRFILSKGHACSIVYAALASRGFFPLEELDGYATPGSRLLAHISHRVPGVEFSTGSLGHGLPFGVGKANAARLSGQSWHTYVVLGDGEMDEGSNWEALLFAAHNKLSNLTAIIDANNLQSLTTVAETLGLEPLADKLTAFGAEVRDGDGHDFDFLRDVLARPVSSQSFNQGPRVVIARTVKGKGVSYMENSVAWHYKSPNPDQLTLALAEIGERTMRNQFVERLGEWAAADPSVVLIVGDLGFGVVDEYSRERPAQFINAGIAEQSMMTMAAGMASEGIRPFVYSIANFPTFRAAEQIRNDVAHHRLPVTVVAVGGGLVYGSLGYSHHAIQDYALIRAMPEMTIYSPGDPHEMDAIVDLMKRNPTPAYLRIGNPATPAVHDGPVEVEPGGLLHVAGPADSDRALVTTGAVLALAREWLDLPEYAGHALYSVPVWGAAYRSQVRDHLAGFTHVVTIEDHLLDGGFGSWILESFASHDVRPRIDIKALDPSVAEVVGKEDHLRSVGGLTP